MLMERSTVERLRERKGDAHLGSVLKAPETHKASAQR